MLEAELIPVVAARFRVLGEPARLAILAALQGGEKSVGELVEATARGQPNTSQHLACLLRAGLVATRRSGNRVFYRIADPYIARICNVVCSSLALHARRERKWMRSLEREGRGGRSRG